MQIVVTTRVYQALLDGGLLEEQKNKNGSYWGSERDDGMLIARLVAGEKAYSIKDSDSWEI